MQPALQCGSRPYAVLAPEQKKKPAWATEGLRPFVIAGFIFFSLLVGSRLAAGYYADHAAGRGPVVLQISDGSE